MDLVDVRDEPAFAWCVDFLVVGPQLTLDGEEQHLQVPFLCEPAEEVELRSEGSEAKTTGDPKPQLYGTEYPCCFSSQGGNTSFSCESEKNQTLAGKPKGQTSFLFLFLELCRPS